MGRLLRLLMILVISAAFSFQAAADSSMARIIGGELAADGEFPFLVAIGSNADGVYCGGTLISDKWVVTAAHCMEDVDTPAEVSDLYVISGTNVINPVSSSNLTSVDRVLIHANFGDTATFNNDIALLELSAAVSADAVDRISTSSYPYFTVGTTATVAGWGDMDSTSASDYPDDLYKVDVPVVSSTVCENTYGSSLTDNMICAGFQAGGADACQGDSGGPLFVDNNDGTQSFIGIVSFGTGCAQPDYYGVYTKVANYVSWIRAHTGLDLFAANLGSVENTISSNSSYDVDTTVVESFTDTFSDEFSGNGTVSANVYVLGGNIEDMNISNSSSTVDLAYTVYGKLELTVDTDGDDDIALVFNYSGEDADRYTLFACTQLAADNAPITCSSDNLDTVYNAAGNWMLLYLDNNDISYDENINGSDISDLGNDKIRTTIFLARSSADVLEDEANAFISGAGGGCSAAGEGSLFSFALMLGFCGAFVLRRKLVKNK